MSKKNKPVQQKVKGTTIDSKKRRSWIYTAIFLSLVLVLFIVNNSGGEPERGPYPPNYKPDPEANLKLSDYEGKIVILDFWAVWCPPCRKGIPDLVEIKKEYADKGVEIIGISLDGITRGGQTKNQVTPFMKEFGINYPVVHGNQNITNLYGGIRSIPTSFVIDKEGKIVSQYVGLVQKSTFVNEINKILAGNYQSKSDAPDFELPKVPAN